MYPLGSMVEIKQQGLREEAEARRLARVAQVHRQPAAPRPGRTMTVTGGLTQFVLALLR